MFAHRARLNAFYAAIFQTTPWFCHCQTAFPSYDAEGIFMATGKTQKQTSGSHLGFEATLWATADKLRGKLRVMVKRILRKHGYPPDKQGKATKTVLEQAELLCAEWDGQSN
jgi:type I restriction enzyme R subunit